jgi:hypothetical protein
MPVEAVNLRDETPSAKIARLQKEIAETVDHGLLAVCGQLDAVAAECEQMQAWPMHEGKKEALRTLASQIRAAQDTITAISVRA